MRALAARHDTNFKLLSERRQGVFGKQLQRLLNHAATMLVVRKRVDTTTELVGELHPMLGGDCIEEEADHCVSRSVHGQARRLWENRFEDCFPLSFGLADRVLQKLPAPRLHGKSGDVLQHVLECRLAYAVLSCHGCIPNRASCSWGPAPGCRGFARSWKWRGRRRGQRSKRHPRRRGRSVRRIRSDRRVRTLRRGRGMRRIRNMRSCKN
mmetsp:Transcript_8389/g.21436  ORF Transcript_8389/g.21436 Transcript_8389/m.21436 type:complete len:210 (-) Transcript_8389:391-1020(-)